MAYKAAAVQKVQETNHNSEGRFASLSFTSLHGAVSDRHTVVLLSASVVVEVFHRRGVSELKLAKHCLDG